MKEKMKMMAMKKSLMQLMEMMDGLEGENYGDELGSMKKVTVAAPDEEGLKKGLSRAEKLMSMRSEMDSDDDSSECEGCEDGCPMCEESPIPMMAKKHKMMK